ncbi:hypothetical protein IIC65_07930, partial [Candidatus Sumerlaeota bacterium]|nr:hypothetical protein [Candidatus Sumerlaeota bacterium]
MIAELRKLCLRAERIRRMALACRVALMAAGSGAAAACLALILARSFALPWHNLWGPALAGAAALAGFVGAFVLGARPLGYVALALEEFYGLKTRFSSALALAPLAESGTPGAPFAKAVIRDAVARVPNVRPAAIIRWRLRLPLGMLGAVALALALATIYYPSLDILGREEARRRAQAEEAMRAGQAQRMDELARA